MKTILVIEDNPDIRENTAEILELADYRVLTAENGKVGVELAKQEKPDLIICDIMMPELDGYGVLHILSKSVETARIPFIFLTAKSEKDDFRKGMNLGADDYITKPFDDLSLLDAVEMRLRKTDARQPAPAKESDGAAPASPEARGLQDLQQMLTDEKRVTLFKKKHTLFAEGNAPHFLYYIQQGKVKTFKTNEEGNEYITGLYSDGDYLGYISLLEDAPYSETAVTLEDARIVVIHRQDFFSLVYNNRDVANQFIRLLSKDVKEKEDRLLKLAYNSVRKRVAEALLMFQKKYQETAGQPFGMAISREDLSNIVGASKETVIRTLSDFKEEKLIDIKGSQITLVNMPKLERMRN